MIERILKWTDSTKKQLRETQVNPLIFEKLRRIQGYLLIIYKHKDSVENSKRLSQHLFTHKIEFSNFL